MNMQGRGAESALKVSCYFGANTNIGKARTIASVGCDQNMKAHSTRKEYLVDRFSNHMHMEAPKTMASKNGRSKIDGTWAIALDTG